MAEFLTSTSALSHRRNCPTWPLRRPRNRLGWRPWTCGLIHERLVYERGLDESDEHGQRGLGAGSGVARTTATSH